MHLRPVQVECGAVTGNAGEESEEVPRRFQYEGEWLDVDEILDRWHQVESKPEWPRANYFKVRDRHRDEYLLKHDREQDGWYLARRWQFFDRPS